MRKLYSNGSGKDFVRAPYAKLIASAADLFVASPYVTLTSELLDAANAGKRVRLLVGLNAATNPASLRSIFGVGNIAIRYYTRRFHAKMYVFDNCALVGSSNLTDGGMHSNREATVFLEQIDQLQDVKALCEELWGNAPVLTEEVLQIFERSNQGFGKYMDPSLKIETDLGRQEPPNISVGSGKKSSEYLFLQALYRRVYEQFKPAFDEVTGTLSKDGMHRSEWSGVDRASETNRFLNWVRLTHGAGNDWQKFPALTKKDELQSSIMALAREWATTSDPRITHDYFSNMEFLRRVFSSKLALNSASRDDLSKALMGVHAFEEQIRFIKGGYSAIIEFFWKENDEDVERVRRSFSHLVFGSGEFIKRLYDVLNLPEWKIRYFGESCALELSGTIRPDMCPPMNGRSAKGLRRLGFDVPAS
jgi:hypothetical protein